MDHDDHVRLIRAGVEGAGRRWLELGAGRGAFTLALADLLGPGAEIVAIDRDAGDLRRLAAAMAERFPATRLRTVPGDFTARLAVGDEPFDGLLAANALHFVRDPASVIGRLRPLLVPAARFVIVEYDTDTGNPWVPHPFSFRTWEATAAAAGLTDTRLVGRVPSRFLGAIYAAASDLDRQLMEPRRGWSTGRDRGLDRIEARATLPASRRGPGGVALHGHGASAGRCEPRGTGSVNVTREP